jgi:hypothetical protein
MCEHAREGGEAVKAEEKAVGGVASARLVRFFDSFGGILLRVCARLEKTGIRMPCVMVKFIVEKDGQFAFPEVVTPPDTALKYLHKKKAGYAGEKYIGWECKSVIVHLLRAHG